MCIEKAADKCLLVQAIEIRNEVMHSAELRLTDDKLTSHIDAMLAILQLPVFLNCGKATKAVADLREVRCVYH